MSSNGRPNAKSSRELIVNQQQRKRSREVFSPTKRFPPEERYSLTDRLRRAARSVGIPIAESWAERAYERHVVSKLTDPDAEQMETQHWLETAKDDAYLAAADGTRLLGLCEEIGRVPGRMIERASSFCTSSTLRENLTDYLGTSPLETPSPTTGH